MVRHRSEILPGVMDLIRRGIVLPAHPLALDEKRRLDAVRQRALTRYYIDSGAGGVAVGVQRPSSRSALKASTSKCYK